MHTNAFHFFFPTHSRTKHRIRERERTEKRHINVLIDLWLCIRREKQKFVGLVSWVLYSHVHTCMRNKHSICMNPCDYLLLLCLLFLVHRFLHENVIVRGGPPVVTSYQMCWFFFALRMMHTILHVYVYACIQRLLPFVRFSSRCVYVCMCVWCLYLYTKICLPLYKNIRLSRQKHYCAIMTQALNLNRWCVDNYTNRKKEAKRELEEENEKHKRRY